MNDSRANHAVAFGDKYKKQSLRYDRDESEPGEYRFGQKAWRAFEKVSAVKTATTQTKAAAADSSQWGIAITGIGRLCPYSRDFSRQGDRRIGS